jgi:hypothetical protein
MVVLENDRRRIPVPPGPVEQPFPEVHAGKRVAREDGGVFFFLTDIPGDVHERDAVNASPPSAVSHV